MIGYIKNQETTSVGFIRTVAMTKDFVIRAVVRNDTRALTSPHSGTYQEVSDGDIAIRYNSIESDEGIKRSAELVSIAVDEDGISFIELEDEYDILKLLNAVGDELLEWLQSDKSNPALPAGYGWDGRYSARDKDKIRKALAWLPKTADIDFIQRFTAAVVRTSSKVINAVPPPVCFKYVNITGWSDYYDAVIITEFNGNMIMLEADELKRSAAAINPDQDTTSIVGIKFLDHGPTNGESLEVKIINIIQ